ncbi:MAG: DUF359 domain-containing protein [Candidatus Lokiarchaeota archaeon]|nr:DUF359 domain-containing protein [Candidatus Harpocratesius repetitus]
MYYKIPSTLREQLAQPIGHHFIGNLEQTDELIDKWIAQQISKHTLSSTSISVPLSNSNFSSTQNFNSYSKYQQDLIKNRPSFPIISCVGDVVSKTFIEKEYLRPYLKYCFIDGGTQRGKKIDITHYPNFKQRKFHNPAGCINDEIIDFIKKTRDDLHQYIVWIDGEEDLLVIPLILKINHGLVFYGQPPLTDLDPQIPAGCVGIRITPQIQNKIEILFNQFILISE